MAKSNSAPRFRQLPDCIEIQLTRGKITYIDLIDADLAQHKWICTDTGYALRKQWLGNDKERSIRLHRVILERIIGRDLQVGEDTDHIDNDRLNNRRDNLRIATRQQNMQHKSIQKNNASGLKGVCFNKRANRWCAQIKVQGKQTSLGYFNTPEEAYAAYCKAAKKYFDKFAKL